MRVAVECFADFTLLEFLRTSCGLSQLTTHHARSQGEVIKAVFQSGRAEAGIVDEDPGKPHHRLRDRTRLIRPGTDVEVRDLDGKYLFVVKEDLEKCFIRAMARVGRASRHRTSKEMHRVLSVSRSPREHTRFAEELGQLRESGARLKIPNLVAELESGLRDLLTNG